jgi:hypothetical protein
VRAGAATAPSLLATLRLDPSKQYLTKLDLLAQSPAEGAEDQYSSSRLGPACHDAVDHALIHVIIERMD